jgi:protein-disulfide isomerase
LIFGLDVDIRRVHGLKGKRMARKHGWLIALVIAALLVAACGPEMATSTPADMIGEGGATSTSAPVVKTPAGETVQPEPSSTVGELPVDADDWHVLGSPDAPVTIIEYSDYQ